MNTNSQLLNNYLPEVLIALVADYTNPHRENFADVLKHFDQFGDPDDDDDDDERAADRHHEWYVLSQVEAQISYCLTCHKSINCDKVDINTDNYEYRECLACSRDEEDEDEDEDEEVAEVSDEVKERVYKRMARDDNIYAIMDGLQISWNEAEKLLVEQEEEDDDEDRLRLRDSNDIYEFFDSFLY